MLLVAKIKAEHMIPMTADEERMVGVERLSVQRSSIPAVTHVDYSARVQTVHRETNPLFYELIAKFSQKSGCDLLLNTSFNVRGEPIVESPSDAIGCFMGTELDGLAIGSFYLRRTWQPNSLRLDYRNRFQPD
jgi:carbamoyltransferase